MMSILSFIDESFTGWIIWAVACGWTVFSFVVHLIEIFRPDPFVQPNGLLVLLPAFIKKLITGIYVLGATAILCLTLIPGISKFHLLWLFPLWHYFGTQWIGLLYERTSLASRNLESAIDSLADLFLPSDKVEALRKHHIKYVETLIREGMPSGRASDHSYPIIFLEYMADLHNVIENSEEVQELQNLLLLVEEVYWSAPRLGVLGFRHRNTRRVLRHILQKGYNRLELIQKNAKK